MQIPNEESILGAQGEPTITYPLQGRIVFDCRYHGGIEMHVEARYRKFLAVVEDIVKRGDLGEDVDGLWGERGRELCPPLFEAMRRIYRGVCSGEREVRRRARGMFGEMITGGRIVVSASVCSELGGDAWEKTSGERRVGMGDQIVEIDILQKIADVLGWDNIAVAYDPIYPNSAELFERSGLQTFPMGGGEAINLEDSGLSGDGWRVVPFRAHPMEMWPRETEDPVDGEKVGYPGAQVLHDLGWEYEIRVLPIQIRLMAKKKDEEQAALIRSEIGGGYVTANPLEVTRRNAVMNAGAWGRILRGGVRKETTILIGCTKDERPKAEGIREKLGGEHRVRIVICKVGTWMELIRKAEHHFCGNNAGMWLGFAARGVPMTVATAQTTLHGTLWEPKNCWFDKDDLSRIRFPDWKGRD